jgi:hypothetical protein
MKLSEYIEKCKNILAEHGDLKVVDSRFPECTIEVGIDYMYKPTDKRLRSPRLWNKYVCKNKNKGEKWTTDLVDRRI